MKIRWVLASLWISSSLAWFTSACSINISDVTPSLPPASATSIPTLAPISQPTTTPTSLEPTSTIVPPQWANLNISGRLIFNQPSSGLTQLDLTTGTLTSLFTLPENGWLTGAALSPDGTMFVMAYGPPPPPDQVQLGYTDLFLLSNDGSIKPQPLLARADPQESYFSPLWSPDGQYLYFAHFKPFRVDDGVQPLVLFQYTIERLKYPDGQPEVVATNAFWPALSPDGTKLAFVSSDPTTYLNDLYVANADGSGIAKVLPPEAFEAVDAPFFTPDGSAVVFSAVGEGLAQPTLFDQWFGVQTVYAEPLAHSVPSDWWRISVAGGAPTRLTRIYDSGLFGDYAPDSKHIAFISATGVYVMSPEGGSVNPLVGLQAFGSVEWIP